MSEIKNVALHHTICLSSLITNIILYFFCDMSFYSCSVSQGLVVMTSILYFALYRIAFSKFNFTTTFVNNEVKEQQDDHKEVSE